MAYYYTFRVLSLEPLKVECCKWEEYSNIPYEKYVVYPHTTSCSCLAMKRECKHVLRVREITKTLELINEMSYWRWDEYNSWTKMYDIPYFEEFERAVFVS